MKGCFRCICGPGGHHACSCMSSDHRDPREGEESLFNNNNNFISLSYTSIHVRFVARCKLRYISRKAGRAVGCVTLHHGGQLP